ncbi:DUF3575 domain-containing protein [Flavobacteriaceae bacterium S356]|uniref:DUF3575 domain-containing protein n=1 Tax=Asprobacillus argus TaxID=3076534 RepID=A0ABU3LAU4_9FLAO|nr:DUF3575 domain-containing protein [Flavobacteriaceae bacterium S356]
MKKIMLLLLFIPAITFAQEDSDILDTDKSHEVKINALSLITSEWIDVSYEYLVNSESSFGVAVQFGLDNDNNFGDTYRTFSLTPYYRRYFSNKYAKGFYVEGFGMLNTNEDFYLQQTTTNFALGISVGGKFVSKNGFTLDLYAGIGRNLGDSLNIEAVGRAGISLGYRF